MPSQKTINEIAKRYVELYGKDKPMLIGEKLHDTGYSDETVDLVLTRVMSMRRKRSKRQKRQPKIIQSTLK